MTPDERGSRFSALVDGCCVDCQLKPYTNGFRCRECHGFYITGVAPTSTEKEAR